MKWSFEPKTFDTLFALDSFLDYWTETENLIQKGANEQEEKYAPKWTSASQEEYGEYAAERDMARHLHDEIMTPTFRNSCIVTLYSIIERELRRIVDTLIKDGGNQKLKVNDIRASSYLGQVSKFIEVFYGHNLTDCKYYKSLCDLQKIRNCIIHCRGEVDLSTDKAYLISLKRQRLGFFAAEGCDIEIGKECVDAFYAETSWFFLWLFEKLDWPVDDEWKSRKPEISVKNRN